MTRTRKIIIITATLAGLAAGAGLADAVTSTGSHHDATRTAVPAAATSSAPTPVQVATRQMCTAATRIYDQVSSSVTVGNLLSSGSQWMFELKQAERIPDQVPGVPDGRNVPRELAVKFGMADLAILLADQEASDLLTMKIGRVRRDMSLATSTLEGATALCASHS